MKNKILKLECIDMTVDFFGICKSNGLVIFVKDMIVNEVCNVKIINIKKNIAYGIIDSFIVKSPKRITTKCSIANKCGGCDIQHIDYDYQLILKKKIVENTFRNMKLDINILEPIKSSEIFYYRNKTQIPVKDNKIGFYRKHSNDIVEFDHCYVEQELSDEISLFIKTLIIKYDISKYIRHIIIKNAYMNNQIMICLVVNDFNIPNIEKIKDEIINKYHINSLLLNLNNQKTNVILGNDIKLLYGNDYIIEKCNDLLFKISLHSFYQVNSKQMIKLYDNILKIANFNLNDRVLDLFCGIGTISLFIAKYVKHVLGIEIVDSAVNDAIYNSKLNNIDNVSFIRSDANDIYDYLDNIDVIIVDPPRKGLDKKLIETISNKNIKKVIYVSCNPATLSRDLKLFEDKYSFNDVQLVDMFPNTKHIEAITLLNLKERIV